MPVLLFSLRNVPEDEAEEVRALLEQHDVNFYETSAGNWGISMPALWLSDTSKLSLAQQLLAEYQQQRYITQRQHYLTQRQTLGIMGNLLKRPFRFTVYTLSALLIVYLSVQLVTAIGQPPKTMLRTPIEPTH